MHAAARDYVETVLHRLPPRLRVLEIGARDINGRIRPLFTRAEWYFGIDIVDGPGVSVVADGATYTPYCSIDTVVCCEVLEHTPDAESICRNAHRILEPGGIFILTTAGLDRPEHGATGGELPAGEFYRNVSAAALHVWLSDFHEAEVNVVPRDVRAVATKAVELT